MMSPCGEIPPFPRCSLNGHLPNILKNVLWKRYEVGIVLINSFTFLCYQNVY